MQIAEWLDKLGLGQYAERFAQNAIDVGILPELMDEDFDKLGVLLGHRRKMLRAIADLDPAALIASTTPPPDAEGPHITVMFCDLVGSTALSARLDPEDMWEVIRAYRAACASVVAAYDGRIARFVGDGILVYFGYPRAHEDDAERAVRAGLDTISAIGQLKTGADERAPRVPTSVFGYWTGCSSRRATTLPLGSRAWRNRARSSLLRRRAGCLVISSRFAISAAVRSRA